MTLARALWSGMLPCLLFALMPAVAATAGAATSDPLLAPPARYAELLPVPALDLSGAEPQAREAIESARVDVRRALLDPEVPESELAEVYGRLGGLYHVHDIPAGAAPAYHNARLLDPDHFRWAYLDAWLAQGSGRLDHALAAYRAARALNPDYPPLALRLGEIQLNLNHPEEAARHLREALEEPGLEAAAAFRLGQLALQQRGFDQAEAWLRRTLDADPDAEAAYTALARALRGQGAAEAARAALARGGERQPMVEDRQVRELEDLDAGARRHFLRGLLAARDGRFQAAAQAFAQGLAENPDNLDARISHARALYLSGERAQAQRELEAVLEQKPNESLANFLLGLLLEVEGQTTLARQAYGRSLAMQPEHPGVSHHLGLLTFRAGEWQRAADLLAQAGAAFPDNIVARVLALVARARAGGPLPEIAAEMESIVAEKPGYPLPRYALSRLLSAAPDPVVQDPESGRTLAEDLLSKSPIPPVHEALALARAAAGDPDGARAALADAEAAYRRVGRVLSLERLAIQRERLAANRLPAEAWPNDDPVLIPPPPDPRGVFQEYPTPRPF